MITNARQYREHLYRLRTHPQPEILQSDFVDQRDSFSWVYLSLIPFLALEYFAELKISGFPSGLICPVGYFLFWAFYYTYYKPGFLENRLSAPDKFDASGIPHVLIGVVIWFVKVSVVELGHFILKLIFTSSRPRRPKGTNRFQEKQQSTRSHTSSSFHQKPFEQSRRRVEDTFVYQPPPPRHGLPAEIVQALAILGLNEKSDWSQIHNRYRALAKQYHPDLNPEITAIGRRFMTYDAAYRKLSAAKGLFK